MCLDRREFFKLGAAAFAWASMNDQTEAYPLPPAAQDEIKSLKSMTTDIKGIDSEEYLARQERARQCMRDARIDAVYIAGGSSMRYFAGMEWGQSERTFGLIIPAKGEIAWVTPAFERARAEELIRFGKDIRSWEEDESPYALIAQVLKDRNASSGTLGIEEQVRFFQSDGISKAAPALRLVPCSAEVSARCRSVKSRHELDLMTLANQITLKAFETAFKTLHEGMTPGELSSAIAAAHRALGAPGGALVLFGENSAFPHGSSVPQRLKLGEAVLADGGCRVEGYSSDITRTVVFGKPSDKQRKVWGIVQKAQQVALEAAKPGVECQAVDAAARKVIEEAGFGPGYKEFTHRVGHGIGLDGHEWFYLVNGNRRKIEAGMTFSNEPGIYLHGEFGIRLEDCMFLTVNGARMFTPPSPSIDHPFG
ncbi:MAG: Xaa-Pro peptidase family protein [Acidobacteriia bacterium]|nr:Xaa-Pro peptidase family protein [Terriglobia bacterium]